MVTHGAYRKKGYAADCLNFAKKIAEENHCYKMMLLTGSKEEVSDDLVSNEGELKWFSLKQLDELEMPYTARYVMNHYCSIGQYSDKIYTGVANENEVIFLELPEF